MIQQDIIHVKMETRNVHLDGMDEIVKKLVSNLMTLLVITNVQKMVKEFAYLTGLVKIAQDFAIQIL